MAIYLVNAGKGERLIEAKTRTVAINHVMTDEIEARPVSASELVQLMNKGIKVEDAGRVAAPDPVPSLDVPQSSVETNTASPDFKSEPETEE